MPQSSTAIIAAPAPDPLMADPTPVAYAIFAFTLALLGVRYVNVDASTVGSAPASVGLLYAFLAAGIAQVLGGVLALLRGMAYSGWVTTMFGTWLIGYFCLGAFGTKDAGFQPDSVTWYVAVIFVPVAILAVPEVIHRNIPFIVAFGAILTLIVLLALGFHDVQQAFDAGNAATAAAESNPSEVAKLAGEAQSSLADAAGTLKIGAWFAFIGAGAVWWVFAAKVLTITGIVTPKAH